MPRGEERKQIERRKEEGDTHLFAHTEVSTPEFPTSSTSDPAIDFLPVFRPAYDSLSSPDRPPWSVCI